MTRILHVLSQRPGRTGSGITLEALTRFVDQRGWEQRVVVGTPGSDPTPRVGDLPADRVHPLVFDTDELPFHLPGMSDVMPYRSRRFSSLTSAELSQYRAAWTRHLSDVLSAFRPDVIHSHHVWLLSSWLEALAPGVPVATHCHGTGFRQMVLSPHLAEEVKRGCAHVDAFCVLHEGHAEEIVDTLGVARERVHVVGAGYREEVFHPGATKAREELAIVYAGKYSHAKGLPWLLDAIEALARERPGVRLHVAGSGAGSEADALRARMEAMAPHVVLHGMLAQEALGDLLRQAKVFVLPSFYEGLPLVVVEAVACGCHAVCTALPHVVAELAPPLGDGITLVPLPRLRGADEPDPEDLPTFVADLTAALRSALAPAAVRPTPDLAEFTWSRVAERVAEAWRQIS